MRAGDIGIVKVDGGWIPKGTRVRIMHVYKCCDECLVANIETGYEATYHRADIKLEGSWVERLHKRQAEEVDRIWRKFNEKIHP